MYFFPFFRKILVEDILRSPVNSGKVFFFFPALLVFPGFGVFFFFFLWGVFFFFQVRVDALPKEPCPSSFFGLLPFFFSPPKPTFLNYRFS